MHVHNAGERQLTELDYARLSKLNGGDLADAFNAVDLLPSRDIAADVVTMNTQVEIVFTETNPFEGALAARQTIPDILFLDIVMPGLSGLELSELLADLDIRVVFITAHAEFLTKAKKTNAYCYLSKPVMSEELGGVFVR